MGHYIKEVKPETELRRGDYVKVGGQWAEIYRISVDDGIFTSRGNICRSQLQETDPVPSALRSIL